MSGIELTFAERKAVKDVVKRNCANFCNYCLPEDAECYMMAIGYRDSPLCKYFQDSILPTSAEMIDIFCRDPTGTKQCGICGRKFIATRNRRYCSDYCATKAKKKMAADRQKKWRNKSS